MKSDHLSPMVVHIIYSLETGGLENGLVYLINRTPSHLFRHTIICLHQSGNFAKRFQQPVPIYSMHKRPGTDPGMYLRLFRLLHELRPAIVHTYNIAALATVPCSLFIHGVRRIHVEHGRDMIELAGDHFKYNCLRKIMGFFVHRYISVSEELRRWLVDTIHINPAKTGQIYNGIDTKRFHPWPGPVPKGLPWDEKNRPLVVGTVGRLAEVKNQRLLLEAYSLLRRCHPDTFTQTRLLIVGDGPLAGALRDLCRNMSMNGQVIFTGHRDDVPELLRTMDIFVLPSFSEGISYTILEAMATKTAVIATDTGGTPELITDRKNGMLVPLAKPKILACRIYELLHNIPLRNKLAEAGYEMVRKKFTWERTTDSYFSLYRELLASAGHSVTNHPHEDG